MIFLYKRIMIFRDFKNLNVRKNCFLFDRKSYKNIKRGRFVLVFDNICFYWKFELILIIYIVVWIISLESC